jgi:cleavage and polyadenylation specificity factor subunit 2
MTSIIKLHAISGAMDESPPCYILQVDDFRILLDCGWDENFDQEFMKELRRYAMSVSLPHCSAISLQILHIHSGLQFP